MAAKKTGSKAKTKATTKPKARKASGPAKRGSKASSSRKTSKPDARTGHRVPIQLLVDYRSSGHYLFDFCVDLGTGGVFIKTEKPLPQGSDIDLTFTLPDSKETISASGKVIWVQSQCRDRKDLTPGMGVQFSKFSGEQREMLQQFVSRYAATPTSVDQKAG